MTFQKIMTVPLKSLQTQAPVPKNTPVLFQGHGRNETRVKSSVRMKSAATHCVTVGISKPSWGIFLQSQESLNIVKSALLIVIYGAEPPLISFCKPRLSLYSFICSLVWTALLCRLYPGPDLEQSM